ncbi:MAG: type I methionyl aminopeptidase [Chloroflexi bacterium RBG_19FT_COMBO_62_14]|nr:MAG: type I methionyl aminopeptidase [Chloroflexi bacterium RBG_19FT_COMBO_62_14]
MNWSRGVVLKSDRELAIMRRAGRINALALLAAVEAVRPGATTADLDAAAVEVLRQHKAEPAFLGYPGAYPYPAATTICLNEELVHGIPGPRRLEEGDLVSIDCGATLEGFVGDSAITVGVGKISDEAGRLLEVTLEALMAGIGAMRLGHRTGDVSAAIQRLVETRGFNVVREYTGHGVGRAMHEDPQVPNYGRQGTGMPLRVGMTIALEPMVLAGRPETQVLEDEWTVASLDRRLTAHFEHSVAVTKDGPVVLTALDPVLDAGLGDRYNGYFAGFLQPVKDKGVRSQ